MKRRWVLLVEDNPDDEELIVRSLKRANFSNPIVIARDGAEALKLLFGEERNKNEEPALIILDINMPKVNGFEVLEDIRKNPKTAHVPVVIMTSSDMQGDVARGYALGANSYVQKPIAFAQFVEAVASVGLYWLLLNVPPPAQE